MAADLAHIQNLGQIQKWLVEEWTARLAAAFEAMVGERLAPAATALTAAPEEEEGALHWRQPLPPLAGAVWVIAASSATAASGAYVLRAVGVEESDHAEQQSTFLEILNQALAGLAQALTARLKREVNSSGGADSSTQPGPASWTAIGVPLGANPGDPAATYALGIETALVEAIRTAEDPPSAAATAIPEAPAPPSRSPFDTSKTFELLLDVELPVAVSFGRAQIPLKDVLKLTTGSIIELDRTVSEPVEIIVNNRVIARGEVVVVEGNFGVRVQEVVNRQERLRTVV
jgi:flagellar motor switch protein FliN/FliY